MLHRKLAWPYTTTNDNHHNDDDDDKIMFAPRAGPAAEVFILSRVLVGIGEGPPP